MYIYICIYNPLKSELFTKQACRDAVVVYSLFFSPTTYTSLYSYVLSTVLRISNFTLYLQLTADSTVYVNIHGINPVDTMDMNTLALSSQATSHNPTIFVLPSAFTYTSTKLLTSKRVLSTN